MSIIGTIHEDVTTEVLGHIGCWQWLVTFVCATLMLPSMLNQYDDMVFLEPSNGIECDLPDELRISNFSLCTYTVLNSTVENRCSKWHVKFLWLIWITKTWLVFCDQEIKLLSTTIICRLGLVFGYISYGLISDNFGRKRAIVLAVSAEIGFRIILTFCDMESWFNLLIFLRSLFTSANNFIGIVLICEIASSSWRTFLNVLVSLPRLLATVCTVSLASSAPNLETYNFIICIFDLCLLLILRWTPESPQWLLFNRKIYEAEKVLLKAAKTNGIDVCSNFKIRPVNHRAYHCLDENRTCVAMLTTQNIRKLSISILVFWGLYYSLWSSLYTRLFSRNKQYTLLGIFSSLIFLISLNWCLSKKLKIRTLLIINIAFMSVCHLSLLFSDCMKFNRSDNYVITSLLLATGVIVHGFILNITPRLLAINIRCTLYGCCHSVGQLGSIICFIIVAFDAANDLISIVIEAVIAIALLCLCYMIPDVDGRELPDVIEDMDYFSELSKPLRWATQKTNSTSREELEIRVYSFGSAAGNVSANSRTNHERPPRIGFTPLFSIPFSFREAINILRNLFHIK